MDWRRARARLRAAKCLREPFSKALGGSRKPRARAGGWKAKMQISRYSRKRLSSLAYLYPPVCTALVPSLSSPLPSLRHRFRSTSPFPRLLLLPSSSSSSHAPTFLSRSTLDLLRPRLYTSLALYPVCVGGCIRGTLKCTWLLGFFVRRQREREEGRRKEVASLLVRALVIDGVGRYLRHPRSGPGGNSSSRSVFHLLYMQHIP